MLRSDLGSPTLMSDDREEKKPFTVRDRRRINLDSEESVDPTPSPPPTEATASRPPAPPAEPPSGVAEPGVPETADAPGRTAAAAGPPPKVDFAGFVASLAAQAATVLGDDEHQEEGEASAREIIAILEMLQDKTEGRRTSDETQIIESVLFQLRMYFVNRGGTGGRA